MDSGIRARLLKAAVSSTGVEPRLYCRRFRLAFFSLPSFPAFASFDLWYIYRPFPENL
jgi:hypothetical protein